MINVFHPQAFSETDIVRSLNILGDIKKKYFTIAISFHHFVV